MAVELHRSRATTDAFLSLAANAGALRQATLDTPPPLAGDVTSGIKCSGARSLWKTVFWAGRISTSAPFSSSSRLDFFPPTELWQTRSGKVQYCYTEVADKPQE